MFDRLCVRTGVIAVIFDNEGTLGCEFIVRVQSADTFTCSKDVRSLWRMRIWGFEIFAMIVLDELLQFHLLITVTLYLNQRILRIIQTSPLSIQYVDKFMFSGFIFQKRRQIIELYKQQRPYLNQMSWETKESKAIPFIIKNESNSYSLTPQAEKFLLELEGPLSIITVAGLYRTGKSYLLNRVILNRGSGFGVGPSINPCTKGLWLWAQAIRAPEGRTLLVVDTEGLGALDEQSNHDMKIFSLAVLLSTNFIYNSVGSIDQTALQTLSLALQLIGSIDPQNFSSRPSLLWVIRDFSLQLVNGNGENITSNEYLELALSSQHLKETSKVQIRKVINQAFCKRDCFTLVKPLIDEQKLQSLDKVPGEELRPQFVSQTIALRKHILNSLKEMKLNNSGALTGKEYAIMIGKYLTAINAGQVPNLMDTWGFIKAQKARVAVDTVRETYNDKLRNRLGSRLPMPSQKLHQLLSNIRKEAVQQFLELSYQEVVHEDLLQFLSICENQMNRVNAKESKAVLTDLLRRQFQPFQKKLLSQYYSDVASYQTDLRTAFNKNLPEKISQKIDIPGLQLELFTERKINEAAKFFEKRAREQVIRARQLKNQADNALQTQLRKLSRTTEEQRKRYQEELLASERKILTLTSEKQRLEDSLEKERREEAQQAEKFRRKTQENQTTLETMAFEIQRLSSTTSEQEKLIFSLKKQLQKEKALSCQKQQYMNEKLQQQQKRYQQLTNDYERQQKNWQSEKRMLTCSSQNKMKIVTVENKQLADQLQELSHQLQQQKYIRKQQEAQLTTLKSKYHEDMQSYKERLNHSNRKESKRDDEDLGVKMQEITERLRQYQQESREWESKHKQVLDQLKSAKCNYEKELAIFTQQNQFQQIQINELRVKNNQLNQSYQRYLEHAHTDNKGLEEMYTRKMNQMNHQHQRSLKFLEEDYEKKIRDAKREALSLANQKQEVELQMSLTIKKASDRETELTQCLKKAEKAYQEVIRRLNNAELDQQAVGKEKQMFYQGRIRQLEAEMQALSQKSAHELEEQNRKTEQNLSVLKDYADRERNQWEKRLEQQREKSVRKLNELNEQWMKRLAEEKQILQGNIQELTERLELTQAEANQKIQTLICDFDIKLQKINNAAMQERIDLNKKLALATQEGQMTKSTLLGQLQEKSKTYQQTLDNVKRQMAYEFQQQMKMVKEALDQSQKRNDSLRKANRKAEENNLLMKSQMDKDKAVFREKIQNLIKERRELQERYLYETQSQNKAIQQLTSSHNSQTRRLNEDIERLRHKVCGAEQEVMQISSERQQEKQSYITKINYLQGKIKRAKDDYADILNKFQSTVKTLSKNNKSEFEREFQDRLEKMKEDYNRKISEKQDSIHQERKEKDDKMMRLQTQNKTLRDRLLIYEMRETSKKGRNQEYEAEFNHMQEQYQRKIMELKQDLQKYSRMYKQAREERDALDNMIRMQKSRISDRSERHSFINQASHLDISSIKPLRENKSVLNYRPSAATNLKKQEKRYMNADEVTGIMKWQQH